jgi:hypothetical protein
MALNTIAGADILYPNTNTLVKLKESRNTTALQCYASNLRLYNFTNAVKSGVLELSLPNTKNIN